MGCKESVHGSLDLDRHLELFTRLLDYKLSEFFCLYMNFIRTGHTDEIRLRTLIPYSPVS